jgi:hypothetical protein
LSGDFVSIATKCIAWRPVSRPKTNVCPSSAPSDLLAPNLQLVRRLVRRSFSEGVSPNPPIPQSPNPPIPQSPFPFLPSSFQSPPAFNISAFPHLPRTSQQQSREAKPFTRLHQSRKAKPFTRPTQIQPRLLESQNRGKPSPRPPQRIQPPSTRLARCHHLGMRAESPLCTRVAHQKTSEVARHTLTQQFGSKT